jgi:hypothetical protein
MLVIDAIATADYDPAAPFAGGITELSAASATAQFTP